MPTYIPKADERDRQWFVIDAQDQVLGKLATRAATLLTGKHKPIYTPFLDTGDHVIVINAAKVHLTGRKESYKLYRHHTLYPGGIRTRLAKEVLADNPERAIQEAVWGMLPKGPLGRRILKKLKIYRGPNHEHAAQQPKVLDPSA